MEKISLDTLLLATSPFWLDGIEDVFDIRLWFNDKRKRQRIIH